MQVVNLNDEGLAFILLENFDKQVFIANDSSILTNDCRVWFGEVGYLDR